MERHSNRTHGPADALPRRTETKPGERHPESEYAENQEDLPSRSAYHSRRKAKKKRRLKYPGIRLLVLLFILLLLLIPYYTKFVEQLEGAEQVFTYKENPDRQYNIAQSGPEAPVSEKQVAAAETPPSESESEPVKPAGKDGNETDSDRESGEEQQPVKEEEPLEEEQQAEPVPDNKESADGQSYKIIIHKVKPEETLFRISMNYYGSRDGEDLIRKWNDFSGNDIEAGQELKIPLPQ